MVGGFGRGLLLGDGQVLGVLGLGAFGGAYVRVAGVGIIIASSAKGYIGRGAGIVVLHRHEEGGGDREGRDGG